MIIFILITWVFYRQVNLQIGEGNLIKMIIFILITWVFYRQVNLQIGDRTG
jgi:hypothetical protein